MRGSAADFRRTKRVAVAVAIEEREGRRVPVLASILASSGASPAAPAGRPIGEIVAAVHERAIDQGLAELAIDGLDRETLEPVLTYCAELKCEADDATCPGCKRRTEADGIASLDALVRRHREIVIGDGGVRLQGLGDGVAAAPSLEALARDWAGEGYWFWARRVIRKLRHGIRRAHIQGSAFAGGGESPAVLLMEPQLADNIGMVARAMANTGLDELRLISPRDGWPNEKARIAASGANYVVDDAASHNALADGIADLQWIAATTARQRDLRKPVLTPEQVVAEMRKRITAGQRCGILFGRERNGLETDEVAVCDAIVMIPVNPRFASLNLAQAVLLIGYEWMRQHDRASLGRVTTYEAPIAPGLNVGSSRPATKEEMLGLYEHLELELERLGYFNPLEKRQTMVRNIRSMLARMDATEQEVRTLRGIVAALAQGKGRGRKSP
jgi:tRNA/rRNA methyltransferase